MDIGEVLEKVSYEKMQWYRGLAQYKREIKEQE